MNSNISFFLLQDSKRLYFIEKKIAFFIIDLYRGGGEKVVVDLSNDLVQRGFDVDLVLVKKRGPYLDLVDKNVEIVDLDVDRIIFSLPKLIRYLKQNKPKALLSISKHPHLISIWAKMISRVDTKIILRLGIPFSRGGSKANWRERILPILIKMFYPFADLIVGNSEFITNDFRSVVKVKDSKITTIYSPKPTEEILSKSLEKTGEDWLDNKDKPVIISVGRLTEQKGFTTLLEAFIKSQEKIDSRLIILGNGEDQEVLEKMAISSGVSDKFKIIGFQKNPYAFMAKSDIYVLPSRYEGMPNAMIEAMICGVPVIASDIPPAVEITRNGEFGINYPLDNVDTLAGEMVGMLGDKNKLEMFGKKAKERVKVFDHEVIMKRYIEAFTC